MNVYHRYVALVKKASVPRVSFHAASRHTCASVAMRSGVHPKVVQELLGHSDISMTLGTYSHVLPEMHQEAATIIAQAMRTKSSASS
jgi:integrase